MKRELIAHTKSSRIYANTGVNIYELIEEIRLAEIKSGDQKNRIDELKNIQDITLYAVIESRRDDHEQSGKRYTESALKSSAYASDEYRAASAAVSDAKALHVRLEATHKALRKQYEALMKETDLLKGEMYLNQIS